MAEVKLRVKGKFVTKEQAAKIREEERLRELEKASRKGKRKCKKKRSYQKRVPDPGQEEESSNVSYRRRSVKRIDKESGKVEKQSRKDAQSTSATKRTSKAMDLVSNG